MDIRIIKSPSAGTMEILKNRISSSFDEDLGCMDALGLVQGKLIDMVCAADIAEKAVGVTVRDVRGSCPQNMVLLAIFGDTAAVEAALAQIKQEMTSCNCDKSVGK